MSSDICEPLRIRQIGLPAWHVLHMVCVAQPQILKEALQPTFRKSGDAFSVNYESVIRGLYSPTAGVDLPRHAPRLRLRAPLGH